MLRIVLVGLLSFACTPLLIAESLTLSLTDTKGMPVAGAEVTYTPNRYAGPPAPLPHALSISQTHLKFKPCTTLVLVGDTISFKNEDSVLHHVFSFSKAKRFDLKLFHRGLQRSSDY